MDRAHLKDEADAALQAEREISAQRVAAARELVDAHKMRTFDVSQFTDPALDRHFAVLQALALREDSLPEQKEDPTNPDYESKPWAAHARRGQSSRGAAPCAARARRSASMG